MLHLVNPIDTPSLKKAFLSVEPFPHFRIDNFLMDEFAEEVYPSFPSFKQAQLPGREFDYVNEQKKFRSLIQSSSDRLFLNFINCSPQMNMFKCGLN